MSVIAETIVVAVISEMVRAGERLSFADGVRLFRTRDIHTLGELATVARERLHGKAAYYNINRHINYSNICVLRCKFCSFYRPYPKDTPATETKELRAERKPDLSGARANQNREPALRVIDESRKLKLAAPSDTYELSVDQIVARAREAHEHGYN